ncbi:MAG: BrnT family toxin [Bacteroidales bacterium]
MLFEYDEHKNELNIEKHKVSFEEAQEIWDDPDSVVFPARKRGEKRKLAIGATYTAVFSVVHTIRGEAIRLISARRATEKEVKRYEQGKNER